MSRFLGYANLPMILVFFGAMLSATAAFWANYRRENVMSRFLSYMNLPMVLVLTGALLSASGAFWANYRQNQEKMLSANQRAQFEADLRAKSDEIAEINKQIAATVTGGDSFCYLMISNIDDKTGTGILLLLHQGLYPLYDVQAQITDVQEFEKRDKKNDNLLWKSRPGSTDLSIGNFAEGARIFSTISLGQTDKRDFIVSFNARNGFWTQWLKFRFVNGKWFSATKVQKVSVNEPVYAEIEDGYPRGPDGQVEWN
ncbi:MAG: hypothetical protein ACLQVJ_13825 [Syntrophobacteraceae bacterium]